jgi:hypothetical protein
MNYDSIASIVVPDLSSGTRALVTVFLCNATLDLYDFPRNHMKFVPSFLNREYL